jgi:hypothetical protein
MEVIFDHGKSFPIADNVVVTRNDVVTNVIFLAENNKKDD